MTQATWRQFFSYVLSEEILVTGCLTQLQVQQVYAGGRSSGSPVVEGDRACGSRASCLPGASLPGVEERRS